MRPQCRLVVHLRRVERAEGASRSIIDEQGVREDSAPAVGSGWAPLERHRSAGYRDEPRLVL